MEEFDDIDETCSEEMQEALLINGDSQSGTSLLKIFIAATIIDNNGKLEISRKAMKEFTDLCKQAGNFELWAEPSENHESLDLTIEWHE